jgi:hypothetical protein
MDYSQMIETKTYVAGNVGSLPPLEIARWIEYMTSTADATLANMRRGNGREKPGRSTILASATRVGAAAATCAPNIRQTCTGVTRLL